ncbi:MAG: discoidin domain-containing protein [Bacteroidetes bacterium]|nr:discoidin domain-containing protein [Bacteroidota bacterium]
MKGNILKTWLLILVCLPGLQTTAQVQYTPYDEFPGVIRSYKPAWCGDLPGWARMLYQDPVNFNDISKAYEAYMQAHPGEESAVIRYFKIWQQAVRPFALPDGTIEMRDPGSYYENLRALQLAVSKNRAKMPATGADWAFVGPKETFWLNETGSLSAPPSCPWQANVYSFDVANSDNNVIYCGTETGFVNKTVNKGLTWQLSGQDYPFGGGVTAVAVHPSNSDIVYVAAGNQVHRTLDGGTTWVPLLAAGSLFYADRLKIDPANPQKILAASSTGVYVSTDGGSAWSKKWSAPAYDIVIRPNDNSQAFALTSLNGKFSVIHSTDGGQTFQAMATFPNTIVESSGGLLAMTPANPNILFALLLSANNTPYLLKGTLAGATWNWALQATGATTSFPMDNGQGYFDLVLGVSPVNENIIFAGTTTLYKSANGGATFNAVGGYSGSFNIHPDIQDIKMLPNGDTWVSTDGGMNFTTDNFGAAANYFVRVNGLIGSDLWGFDQGWNEDIMVGGRYHNGNMAIAGFYQPKALRMGGAESPTGWVLQGKSRHVAFDDLGNGWILPQTAEGKPEGRFIFSKYPNMDEYGGRRSNLVHHPNYYGTLFLGEGTGFWRSTDMGVTWDLLYNFPAKVRYLQISFSNPDVIYADIVGGGLCKSTDGGMNWVLKPSLTSPPYGTANWKGKLFIAISPHDDNLVYACLQNGTWSADLGKVFRSADGGDTWEDLTGSLSEYMKCMVVQPDLAGNDLIYLFTNATNGKTAKVFYRTTGMTDWALFSDRYPAGMTVNMALPFFRDGKLRVGGNAGVWESPLADTTFSPVINPWIEKALYDCMLDTLFFDDHSIIDHSGATWQWTITPQPAWIDDAGIRNPRVVLGNPGTYDVSMTVTKYGQGFSKTMLGMVSATACPSIYDCGNPAELPKSGWSLLYVDSEELNYPGLATMSFDDDPSTIWHTRWSTGNDPYPHEIRIGLGGRYRISKFTYLPRQDGENGRIRNFELYISEDTASWGVPVKTGLFVNTAAPQTIVFDTAVSGRYMRLVALSEVNGNPWASAAEFSLVGCVDWPAGIRPEAFSSNITAFPVPTSDIVEIALPSGKSFRYQVISSSGGIVSAGTIENPHDTWPVNLGNASPGVYLVQLKDDKGVIYRVKVVKN